MYIKNLNIILLYFILFDKLKSICLIKNKQFFINNIKNNKSLLIRSKPKKTNVKTKISNISIRKINKPLFLFDKLKKCVFFFRYLKNNKDDEKFLEDIILNINDLNKIKQLSNNNKNKELKKENIKKVLLYAIFSRVNFKIINCLSYLIKHFEIDKKIIGSIFNEISEQIKEKKYAENFLTLHFFLLKNEDIEIFSMINILDFFKTKQKILETIENIKKKIYEECVNDLLRKKIERYNLFCERKKIKFDLNDAMKKVELNLKEDLYFNYDNDLLKIFDKKISIKKMKRSDTLEEKLNIPIEEKIDENLETPDDENLKVLKETYEELQHFKESIIQYIEEDQDFFYFDDENNIKKETNNEYNKEEELKMQKNIDDYIEKYTKDFNKSIEQLKNHFIDQADLNFKNFLNNLKLNNIEIKRRETKISNNEIATFELKKLNKSDENLNITNDLIYERLRIKLIYYIQKIEYIKFKYQYDIINEKFPMNKNEKTVLDVLKYGYKIVVCPDIDNSIFQKEHMKETNKPNKTNDIILQQKKKYFDFKCHECNYYIFNTNNKESSEKIKVCPQCNTKI
ncbi:conserved Plasmodium protein, unknown function [Plasmodium gallinaceum]|uniref:Uncharacterized protein n=1 Tax=Plasmodium gallinaceum TaxID=5849 RepID=A0A1J1GS86_PLAGA|nr:conserved Plasmodium protein, unknown function [Plasmodium gallinaceum]CRG95361.1 conserved Plasmodium protein, unknown function [Plasmodium gallinaceum]